MEPFANRYELKQRWKQTGNGWLANAFDQKLKRKVMVYRIRADGEIQKLEAMRWLSKAAHFSDKRFLHILDVVSEEDGLYAVLSSESGGLLSDRLRKIQWSGREILERIQDLISGIREVRRDRLPEFALTADNIWMDGEGKLRFINYWTEADAKCRGVRGLSSLLYQICSRKEENPSSMPEFYKALRSVLTDLPGGSADQAADWACTAFNPSCSLREYESGLNRLLDDKTTGLSASAEPPSRSKHAADSNPPRSFAAFRLRPWHLFAMAVFIICVWLGVFLNRPHSEKDGPESMPHTASSGAAAFGNVSPTPKPASAPVQGNSPSPSSSPSPAASLKPSAAPNEQGAVVPDLTGRTKEEAEKLVLQAGLHYDYFLETNELAKGLVFRQDLTPGTPAGKGDKIVFWISKGK